VSLEKTAFGKLKSALFKDISKFTLATETFEFKNQGSIGRHGPVTIISFDNVTLATIPYHAFFSTLAEVSIRRSYIGEIQSEAFSANQISSISFINCTIDYVHGNAFISRTLIFNFKIEKCIIKRIGAGAIMAGMANLTVQHSK
jgi:hypothetical protein